MKEIIAREEDGIYKPRVIIGERTPEGRKLEFINKPAETIWIGSAQCKKYPKKIKSIEEII